MTDQMTTTNPEPTIDQALEALTAELESNVLMSQDRCVDALLDLYNAAPNDVVRELVAAMIDPIRHLSAVRSDTMLAQIDEVTAARAVERAFG
jgi:hypothetical protein